MRILLIILLAHSTTAWCADAESLPDELVKQLTTTIRENCPDAEIEVRDNLFTAKHGTMEFTLHSKSKTGEISPRTYQQEGPNFKGFILTVSLQKGRYQGAAVIPQTLEGPYYPTFIDGPATGNGSGHYWVNFSYGRRLDEKIRTAILEAIPKTTFPSGAPSTGRPQAPPEKNPTSTANGSSH